VSKRLLLVVADDYGIGAGVSLGILELALQGRVTASVLLVTSPHAEAAVRAWERAGRPMALGWHPCLTLDRPVLPPDRVPSLVNAAGGFWPLGQFLGRLLRGRVRAADVEAELRAQLRRFEELTGFPPPVVNSHHHVQVFPPVGVVLQRLFDGARPKPYLRRVREPWTMLARVPGARAKRLLLSAFGRRDGRRLERSGFPGNDWVIGITDPACVADRRFLERWLSRVPGRVVELTCHPGHLDLSLIGRDCSPQDGQLQRRVFEYELLSEPEFPDACRRSGFRLLGPAAGNPASRAPFGDAA
jgi:predicted glycoside hydrolase/deacetylase ChbG (UPF0249 family)